MRLLKSIILYFLLTYLPLQSLAWGQLGHRVVGQIADSYLTAKARKNIKAILGYESLAMGSTWADFIKSDPAYKYLDNWHYINLEEGLNKEQVKDFLEKDTLTDAYTKLNFLIAELKKKELAPDTQKMYLRLLIHIIGDIHQPLHVARAEGFGGNRIFVMWFNENSNLHRVWDDQLLAFQQLSYTEFANAINHTTKADRKVWQEQPMTEWFWESYVISQKLYKEITQPDQKLGYRYNFDHVDELKQCLLKAGVRLAGLLNAIFG